MRPVCVQKVSNSSHPPLPQLDMPAFTVEYRVNIIDKKYSSRATEYYDFKHNKVRIDFQKNGLRQGILFQYEDNAVIVYQYLDPEETKYNCRIQQLDQVKDDTFNIFGFSKGRSSSVPHVVSSRDILQFANDTEQEYKGETTLNGLRVTRWQSCHYWEDIKANFILDYYFTTKDFKSIGDGTPRQVPLRAEVNGVIDPQGDNKSIHHVYEYMNFRAHKSLPEETFSLPNFMVCEGAQTNWTHEFPILPESMSYILERVVRKPGNDNSKVGAITWRVFLDATRRLVRTDHATVTTIRDFNTGVQYVISQNGCETSPITSASFSATEEDGIIKIRDRPEIAYLKQNFSFAGPKLYREISALSFASKLKNNDNLEAYLTRNNKIPIGLIVRNVQAQTETYYNIFDFAKTAYPEYDLKDPFDIQRCTDSNKIYEFDITLKYESQYKGKLKDWANEIVVGLRDYIAQISGVSFLQISRKDYHIDESKQEFQWFGIFLGAITNTEVAKVENQVPIKTYESFLSALQTSIDNGKFSKTILVGTAVSEYSIRLDGKILRSEGNDYQTHSARNSPLNKFQHFSEFCVKSFEDLEIRRIKNSVYECARACLDSNWTGCNVFQYSPASRECIMSMQVSLPALARTPGCDFYTLSYLSHFERFPGEVLLKANNVVHKQVSTAEVCARQCLDEKNFKCESFNFCEDEDRCLLYKSHYYEYNIELAPTSQDDITSCTHYSRKRLDDFKTVVSTDFAVLDSELTEVEAKSVHQCAYLCQENCTMFSSCLRDQSLVCKFVTASSLKQVKYISDASCNVHKGPDSQIKNIRPSDPSETGSKEKTRGEQRTSGYSGGAMFGVAAAMILTGVGVGALTIFLLHYFRVWNGFQ